MKNHPVQILHKILFENVSKINPSSTRFQLKPFLDLQLLIGPKGELSINYQLKQDVAKSRPSFDTTSTGFLNILCRFVWNGHSSKKSSLAGKTIKQVFCLLALRTALYLFQGAVTNGIRWEKSTS